MSPQLLIALSAAFALTSVCCAGALPLGAHPAGADTFRAAEERGSFVCDGGRTTLPFGAVNDGYCDCQDAADEPGTAACGNGSFWCANAGHRGVAVSSSKVGDGICDCCDGSDEKAGVCGDNCEELGRKAREEYLRLVEKQAVGFRKRQEHIKEASGVRSRKEQRLQEVNAELEVVKREVDQLDGMISKAEKQEAQLTEEQKKERADAEEEEENRKAGEESKDGNGNAAQQPAAAEGPEDPSPDQTAEDDESWWDRITGWFSRDNLGEIYHKVIGTKELDRLRSKLRDTRSRRADLERELNELNSFLNMDFGPDRAFQYLHGQCFVAPTREYDYELCPFDKVVQRSRKDSSSSNLGRWGNWEDSGRAFKMTNGDGCWQGPNRTMKVKLQCGPEDKAEKVEEPTRCVYEMVFHTPAICEEPPSQEEMESTKSRR